MQQMHVDLHARLGAVLALNVWRLGAAICARMHRSLNVYCAWHCSPALSLGLLVCEMAMCSSRPRAMRQPSAAQMANTSLRLAWDA